MKKSVGVYGRLFRWMGLVPLMALAFAGHASELGDLENRVFGRPDWIPPESWRPPEVCGRDFWPIILFPTTALYDPFAQFAPGDEWTNFALFRDAGANVQGYSKDYSRCVLSKRMAPAYMIGDRYNLGWSFVPLDRLPAAPPFWEKMRKDGHAGMPEAAIDGKMDTFWATSKLFPEWLCGELGTESELDNARFFPYSPDKPIFKYYIEVSTDGIHWKMAADRRDNDQPLTAENGISVHFVPLRAKFVRLTIIGLDSLNSNIYEFEARRGETKIPFSGVTASSGYYEDCFAAKTQLIQTGRSWGEAFLGFSTEEWGNDIGHLQSYWAGKQDVYSQSFGSTNSGYEQYIPKKPTSRAAYLKFLEGECKRLIQRHGGKWFDLESHPQSFLTACTLEWGASLAACEFHLAGPNNYSAMVDILRGAARQYGKPMLSYLTSYNGGDGVRSEKTLKAEMQPGWKKPWDDDNPHNGVSIEFQRRWIWFLYLSGTSLLDFRESAYFYDRGPDHVQKLSDFGRMLLESYEQTRKHPERGIRATPIAFAFDYSYGPARWYDPDGKGADGAEIKTVDSLSHAGVYNNITRCEQIDWRFICFDEKRGSRYRPEIGALRNRAIGEVFDWIMLNAPSGAGEQALANYRAIYLLGRIDPTPALQQALQRHLESGGSVIARPEHLDCLPPAYRNIKVIRAIDAAEDIYDDFSRREFVMAPYYGMVLKDNVKGRYALTLVEAKESRTICRDRVNRPVILWTGAGKGGVFWVLADLPGHNFLPPEVDLLQHIAEHALPFTVRGDIQHLINRTKDGWVVGLFNNRGVYKNDPYKEAEVDQGESSPVEVIFTGKKVGRVSEWLTGERIRPEETGNQFKISLTVPAGEVRILQLAGAR